MESLKFACRRLFQHLPYSVTYRALNLEEIAVAGGIVVVEDGLRLLLRIFEQYEGDRMSEPLWSERH